jgi:hypothetical protein
MSKFFSLPPVNSQVRQDQPPKGSQMMGGPGQMPPGMQRGPPPGYQGPPMQGPPGRQGPPPMMQGPPPGGPPMQGTPGRPMQPMQGPPSTVARAANPQHQARTPVYLLVQGLILLMVRLLQTQWAEPKCSTLYKPINLLSQADLRSIVWAAVVFTNFVRAE